MFTRIARVSPDAPFPIVSLSEIKSHLYISHSDEDDYLESLAATATSLIDGPNGIGISVEPTTYVATLDRLHRCTELPLSPVKSITSITVDGLALDSENYRLITGRNPQVLHCEPQSSTQRDAIEITFVSGFEIVPPDLKHAALLLVGHWYRNREATTDISIDEIPLGVEALLSRYRAVVA